MNENTASAKKNLLVAALIFIALVATSALGSVFGGTLNVNNFLGNLMGLGIFSGIAYLVVAVIFKIRQNTSWYIWLAFGLALILLGIILLGRCLGAGNCVT